MADPCAENRFWAKVDRQRDNECWPWLGTVSGKYGRFYIGGKTVQAHRFACGLAGKPIPVDLVADHLCLNKLCVNPAHIEPVTVGENTRRGYTPERRALAALQFTHCLRGHAFSGANAKFDPRGRRVCQECRRLRGRERARQISGRGLTGPAQPNRKVDYARCVQLRQSGLTYKQVAEQLGIAFQTVGKIMRKAA